MDGKNECAEWLLNQFAKCAKVSGWCRMDVQGVEETWAPYGLQVDPNLTAGWEQRAVPEWSL